MACAAIGLTLFGLVMVYSASGFNASTQLEGSFSAVLRQAGWAVVGIIAMLILMRVNYQRYASPALILLGLATSVCLLIAVLFFDEVKGAKRWIKLGPLSAQPSELAKITLVMFLAYFLTRRTEENQEGSFQSTFLPAAVVTGMLMLLILKEPDLGTALMIGVIFVAMMVVGWTRKATRKKQATKFYNRFMRWGQVAFQAWGWAAVNKNLAFCRKPKRISSLLSWAKN